MCTLYCMSVLLHTPTYTGTLEIVSLDNRHVKLYNSLFYRIVYWKCLTIFTYSLCFYKTSLHKFSFDFFFSLSTNSFQKIKIDSCCSNVKFEQNNRRNNLNWSKQLQINTLQIITLFWVIASEHQFEMHIWYTFWICN